MGYMRPHVYGLCEGLLLLLPNIHLYLVLLSPVSVQDDVYVGPLVVLYLRKKP